jgi:hypothetical protein
VITSVVNNINWDKVDSIRSSLLLFEEKFACYESEYRFLEESATLLELALWKVNMNELSPNNEMENTDTRKQYCVSYGAEFVVPHVLSFLLLA